MSDKPMTRAERAAQALETLTEKRRREDFVAEGRTGNGARSGAPDMSVDAVLHGVTVGWLAQAFHMNNAAVKIKLRDCPPMFRRKGGFVYDLKMATRYLVPPVFDVDEYLKTMKVEDLPIRLQTEYWNAKLKRQQFEEEAGQLWRAGVVIDFLGKQFQTMKFTMQLWVDELEKKNALTPEIRQMITKQVDSLQNEIHKKVLELAKTQRTPSVLEEDRAQEREMKAREARIQETAADASDDIEEEDYEYSHLI